MDFVNVLIQHALWARPNRRSERHTFNSNAFADNGVNPGCIHA